MATGNPRPVFGRLADLLEPSSIAVIGASDQPGNLGGRAVRLLRKFHYPGQIWPVNPKRVTVADLPCYPSVSELPGRASLAVIAVNAAAVSKTIEECVRAGIHSGIVWAAGFAEVGGEGVALQQELIDVCRRTDFQLCGPNSIGIINSSRPMIGSFASSLISADRLIPGSISMVSQSGGIGTAAFALAQQSGFGFRHFVSSGNEAVLTTSDFLSAFADDPKTKVIAVYLEGLRDGASFIAAMEKARAAGKPVVVLKAGSSAVSARAAKAHTGALAGEVRVWQAILREQNAVTVESNQELLDVALSLGSMDRETLPKGNRAAIVTFGGGGGVLSADLCARYGLENPELSQATAERLLPLLPAIASVANPIDLTPDMFQSERLRHLSDVLETIASDANIDLLFLPLSAMARGAADVAEAILEFRARSAKPIFISWVLAPPEGIDPLTQACMYVFPEPSRAVRVMEKVASYASEMTCEPVARGEPSAFDWPALIPRAEAGAVFTEDVCHRILDAAGLAIAPGRLAKSETEAVAAAHAVEFPVALKGISPDVTHRAIAELLALDLRDEEAVRCAYQELTAQAKNLNISFDGLYVQHMVKGGLELLVSAFRDPVFGVMIVTGAGGNLAEIADDVTLERAPFDAAHAARVLQRLKIVQRASRVDASADVHAAAAFVSRFSAIAATAPWRRFTLEVNPIKWSGNSVAAVDGLLIVEEP